MRKIRLIAMMFIVATLSMTMSSCSKVPAGNIGIKFYLLGGSKGVDQEVLKPGRYWIGVNEELYLFPTFTQNYVWTQSVAEGSENDESITFQTSNGLSANVDVGITYHLEPNHIPNIFQKYKRGIDEITDIFLRNYVRDAFVDVASTRDLEYIYGAGKRELMNNVEHQVRQDVADIGIIIDKLYLVGDIRLPKSVKASIDSKIKMTQEAQKAENEVRKVRAQSAKQIVKAQADSASVVIRALGQAYANKLLNQSISNQLIDYKRTIKWDGRLPQVTGSSMPMVSIR